MIPAALLSKDVLLVVKKFGGELKVLAWNLHTKAEIFRKKLPAGQVVLDHHNQQVMVGRDQGPGTRLEITGNTVTETNQTHLPGLWAFSHPNYLIGIGGVAALWRLDGIELTKIGGLNILAHSVFCPARDLIVSCGGLFNDKIVLRVLSSQTGQLVKHRVLTSPITISVCGLQVNSNQLAVLAWQHPGGQYVLLVFDLDCILSQSADQEICSRMFLLGQHYSFSFPTFLTYWIFSNKTSVTAVLKVIGMDTEKIITLDFWNCEN